jgi:hypothetical protein
MRSFALATLIILSGLSATADLAQAQQPARVDSLSSMDREFMAQQRKRIDDLARFHFGRQLRTEKANDLDILQTLLDRGLVRPEQTLELQAMGVVMGDLLASELDMKWVVYEDKLGRSRALQFGRSDNFLFPITMISRRAEVGSTVDVEAIYNKAASMIEPYRTPLPFR